MHWTARPSRLPPHLAGTTATADAADVGDPFLLGEEFRAMPQSEVARTFGEGFAQKLSAAGAGRLAGAIASSFGMHFVFINEHAKGGIPSITSVREAVQREWQNARRMEAEQNFIGRCVTATRLSWRCRQGCNVPRVAR